MLTANKSNSLKPLERKYYLPWEKSSYLMTSEARSRILLNPQSCHLRFEQKRFPSAECGVKQVMHNKPLFCNGYLPNNHDDLGRT